MDEDWSGGLCVDMFGCLCVCLSQPGRREAIRRLIGAGIAHASL
jgi:hypothetical protein